MKDHPKPSLVSAWNMHIRPSGSGQAQLTFRPLVSSAKKYVGVDYRSDGNTLWVTFKSCLVNEDCTAMSAAMLAPNAPDRFTYAVVIPYQGEKVMVQGSGGQQEELPVSR